MRVLGIETSTRRGSVALVEDGSVVASALHVRDNAHAELVLPLIAELFARAGWARGSIDRIGVGVGPGAFTGIRVGIALAQGMGLGLDRPVFGVGSLEAMAAAVPLEQQGTRCPLLDARRNEIFLAAYLPGGGSVPPQAVAREETLAVIARLTAEPRVIVGEIAGELTPAAWRSEETDLPHATWTARLASERAETLVGAEPHYVRGPGITLPDLPPSPFSSAVDAWRTNG